MRRLVAVVLAVIVGVGLTASPSSAAPNTQLNRRVSGPFEGTTEFQFGTEGCSFVFQVWEGTYRTAQNKEGTFRLEGCVQASGTFPFTGTFTLTAPNGAVLTGTVSGSVFGGPGGGQAFTLRVVEGTKNFRRVVGTILLLSTWPGGSSFSGTLAGSLQRA